MAWQLLYTSAPRLLEAGHSGFGTIARHREIPPLLVSAIERASQFARAPGLDAGRVIYSHRIVAIAGTRFHVLSCIRDAGADYTGRTNHLAHHLIIEPREVAALGARGPSPADVLLAMRWRNAWSDAPRSLDAADEIAIASITPQTDGSGSAWARITRNPAHARLLIGSEASRGACVVIPPGCDLRPLFAESLRLAPERLWQMTFTTALQPSDDAAEFRWFGVEAASPLRDHAAGRITFDLTAPASLPTPDLPQAATSTATRPTSSVPAERSAPKTATPHAPNPKPAAGASADPFLDFKPARPMPWKWIAAGGAALVLALGAGFAWPLWRTHQELNRERTDIVQLAISSGYFDPQQTGAKLDAALREARPEQLPKVRALVSAAAAQAQFLNAPDYETLRRQPALASLQTLVRDAGITLPSEMATLAELLDQAARAEKSLREFQPDSAREADLVDLKAKRKEHQSLAANLPQQQAARFEKIRTGLDQLAARQQAATLRRWIEEPLGTLSFFQREQKELGPINSDAVSAEDRKRLSDVLAGWTWVEEQPAQVIAKHLATRPEWPRWLLAKAREKAALPAETTVAEKSQKPSGAPMTTRGGGPAQIFWVPEKGKLAIPLPAPTATLRYFLKTNASAPMELNRYGGGNRLGPEGAYFKIEGETLMPASAEPEPPYEITIQREQGTLMRILVGLPGDGEPLLGRAASALRFDDKKVKITAALPTLVAAPGVEWILKQEVANPQIVPFALVLSESGEGDLGAAVKTVTAQIAAKRAEADSLAKAASNFTNQEKPIEPLRDRAREYAKALKIDPKTSKFDPNAKTPAELVGTFVMAAANVLESGKSDRAFIDLFEKAKKLADARGDEKTARLQIKDLLKETQELERTHRTTDTALALGNVRSLSTSLSAMLGDGADPKTEIERMNKLADAAEREAKRLESLPIFAGKLPPGDYAVIARLKDGPEVKLYILSSAAQ